MYDSRESEDDFGQAKTPRPDHFARPATTLAVRNGNEAAIIAAATAYRNATNALDAHIGLGRTSWKEALGASDPDPVVASAWRRRRLELTEAVSKARIALLEAAVA